MATPEPDRPVQAGALRSDGVVCAPLSQPAWTFASLEQQLTTYICYAQVFGDALTFEELVSRCGQERARVRAALSGLLRSRRVVEEAGFHFLPGRSSGDHAVRRAQRRELAERILAENRRLLAVLKRLPFVRLVAVSGSVAAANPVPSGDGGPDCDLFIITADDSLHIVRFALRLLIKIGQQAPWLGFVSRPYRPCPNFMVEESSSEIENESLYTATEAFQVRVLKGHDAYHEFVQRNRWIGRYYAGPWLVREAAGNGAGYRKVRWRWIASAVNLACFAALWAGSWLKASFLGTECSYSIRTDLSKEKSLRRARPVAGGYQALVRRRFAELYRAHFAQFCSEEYLEFLFPRTSDVGIWQGGRVFEAPRRLSLSPYVRLLSARS
jgi:hypothetical protein